MRSSNCKSEISLDQLSPVDVPIDALPVVEFSGDDLGLVATLAASRSDSYDGFDGETAFGDIDTLSRHQIGVLGELAVAHWYGVDIDTATYEWGDDGTDLTLLGKDVDVKTTSTQKMRLPQLLVRADKPLTADLYVRAHVIDWDSDRASIRLLGYAPRERVISRDPRRHPGTARNYVVEPAELTLLPSVRPTP